MSHGPVTAADAGTDQPDAVVSTMARTTATHVPIAMGRREKDEHRIVPLLGKGSAPPDRLWTGRPPSTPDTAPVLRGQGVRNGVRWLPAPEAPGLVQVVALAGGLAGPLDHLGACGGGD